MYSIIIIVVVVVIIIVIVVIIIKDISKNPIVLVSHSHQFHLDHSTFSL